MKIAIRLDDITPDMDWERFLEAKEILDKYGIKPLIGVVPDNQDENLHKAKAAGDFWEYIRDLQDKGWCIAMHGYRHIYSTKKGGVFPLNHFSEFAGLPYETQKTMLVHGSEILKRNGIKTDIFMAPAHSYDKNTIKALKELGYTKMTDGFGKYPYQWQGMSFYPISFLLSRSLKKKKGYTTMVIHTNTLSDEGINRLRSICEKYRKDMVSYQSFLDEKIRKRSFAGHIRENFLARVKHGLVKIKEKKT